MPRRDCSYCSCCNTSRGYNMPATPDLLDLIGRDVTLRRVASTNGGEYAGPCPFCGSGDDRFRVWPEEGRYWCRVCERHGDGIQYLRDRHGLGYREARERLGLAELERTP